MPISHLIPAGADQMHQAFAWNISDILPVTKFASQENFFAGEIQQFLKLLFNLPLASVDISFLEIFLPQGGH
jgi:hypothetical protein